VSALGWVLAAVLGGGAAILRFLLDGLVSARAGRELPLGTLAVNLSGAFALGLVTGLALSGDEATLVGGAAIGSYTTFSTWMLETHRLAEDGEVVAAWANVAVSLATGLAAAALGRAIGAHV
jgi:CrcB protein